jgi:hypothetical protein
MNLTWKTRFPIVLAVALAAAALVLALRSQPALAEREATRATTPGRFSVVETEGHNLIVTDNKSNTLYFYTIDKDKQVGSELKLRGAIDLNQVGKPTIKLTKGNAE